MTQQVAPPTGDSKRYPEPEQVDRLIAVAANPRDKAPVGVRGKVAIRVSEAIQLKVSDIDFQRAILFT